MTMPKILVIDDEESIREMMQMSLRSDGYQVLTAADGPTSLEIVKKESPEIVLLDVRMPDMDGIEVLERAKAYNPDIEVIMITGHGDMQMAIECMRKEASDFLVKPVSDQFLEFALRRSREKLALKKKIKQYTENLETLVREANVELERAYQFRENLIENSPDAIVCVKKGGDIIIFNSAAEKLLGYSKREVLGKMNIVDVYQPGDAKQVMKDLRSDDYGGKGIRQKREMVVLNKQGEKIPVYLSASILYERGQEAGSVGIFTDLRRRKIMEAELLQREKLASLGKLAAGIAHEINQPLTGVLTFASLLLKKHKDDAQTSKDLEVIVRETTRIRRIVQGVLDFARETPVQKKPNRIEKVLDQTLQIVQHQERFFGIELKKEYAPDVPDVVMDAGQMEQVVLNIVLNAAAAMNRSGTLTIRTRKAGDWVEVDFQDTGPGMPQAIVDRIFDPFFTTKDSSEGSSMGLGLAISYGIVKNHKGEILVKSKQGEGSTFTIKLPVNA